MLSRETLASEICFHKQTEQLNSLVGRLYKAKKKSEV